MNLSRSVIAALVIVAPGILNAQRSIPVSVEVGGLYQRLTGNLKSQSDPGIGYEAQIRVGGGGWSLGVGVDYVQHERKLVTLIGSEPTVSTRADANFFGAFVEPRVTLGDQGSAVQPYLMVRVGIGRATPEIEVGSSVVEVPVKSFTWNGGLGVLVRLAGPLSGDFSVSGGTARWKSDDDGINGEQTIGDGTTTGANVTARLGLRISVR